MLAEKIREIELRGLAIAGGVGVSVFGGLAEGRP
jgi:hypothetical protein